MTKTIAEKLAVLDVWNAQKRKIVVLERWEKEGYQNRLVTDGYRIWLEYLPLFGDTIVREESWRVDESSHRDYWLIDFNGKN